MNKTEPRFIAGTATGKAGKFWNVADTGSESGEITLYGDIYDKPPVDFWTGELEPGKYITPDGFLNDLENIKGKANVTVKINSCGGDLYTGIAIHNALKALSGKKIVQIEGIAASAASVIAMAGDEVQMYPGSMLMIHGVSADLSEMGPLTMADIKKLQKSCDANEKAIAEIYHSKTGIEVDKLRAMMERETWFVGKEAIDNGFADKLINSEGENDEKDDEDDEKKAIVEVENGKKILFVAGIKHDITGFKNVPKSIPTKKEAALQTKTANSSAALAESVEELRRLYPQLVAEIEKTATEKERERIKSIDKIASKPGAAALAYSAKYTEICTADKLALKVLESQQDYNAQRLTSITNDARNSGVNNVGANANGGEPNANKSDETSAAIDKIVNVVNKLNGGTNNGKT